MVFLQAEKVQMRKAAFSENKRCVRHFLLRRFSPALAAAPVKAEAIGAVPLLSPSFAANIFILYACRKVFAGFPGSAKREVTYFWLLLGSGKAGVS